MRLGIKHEGRHDRADYLGDDIGQHVLLIEPSSGHSRRVVGWAVSDRMKKDLAIRALDMAANLRNPPKDCIFHSDRGSQYAAYDYQKRLQKCEITPSMSGKGNCYDNAAVATFFKSLKAELIWRQSWPTRRKTGTSPPQLQID